MPTNCLGFNTEQNINQNQKKKYYYHNINNTDFNNSMYEDYNYENEDMNQSSLEGLMPNQNNTKQIKKKSHERVPPIQQVFKEDQLIGDHTGLQPDTDKKVQDPEHQLNYLENQKQ